MAHKYHNSLLTLFKLKTMNRSARAGFWLILS